MKTPTLLLTVLLGVATLTVTPPAARAQQAAATPKPTAATAPRNKGQATSSRYPFRGKIAAVDARAGTFTLEGKTAQRVIAVTSETKIMKNGALAKLSDAAVGEDSGGMVQRGADGKLTALSVRFGAKPEKMTKKSGAASSPSADQPSSEPAANASPSPKPARTKRKTAAPAPTPTQG